MMFPDVCLLILACVFGFCLLGTALTEMGLRGSLVLVVLIIIGVFADRIEQKIKARKEKKEKISEDC